MKIKHLLLSAIAVATALVSCQKDLSKETASVSLSVAELNFESTKTDTKTITLSSTRTWIAEIPAAAKEWVSVSPDKGEASADPQTIEITVKDNGGFDRSADITFKIRGGSRILKVNQKGDQGAAQPGDGTAAHPYSVAEARAFIDGLAGSTSKSVYVKGYVHKISSFDPAKFTSINLFITDDMSDTKNDMELFSTLDFNGGPFTSKDEVDNRVKTGDVVVAYGPLKLYNSTYEMVKGQFVSVNGVGAPVEQGEVTGIVIAKSADSFLVRPEKGDIVYVYGTDVTSQVKIGNTVKVTGTKATFWDGTPELKECKVIIESSEEAVIEHLPAQELVGTAVDNYNQLFGYVKITGVLSINAQSNTTHYNLIIPAANMDGSIVSPENIDPSWNGKNLDVTGYFVGTSGKKKYFNILATSIAVSANQPVVEEPGEGSIVLTFPDENSENNNVNNYTSKWTAKTGEFEFIFNAFSNNNWNNWKYVKCGHKSNPTTPSIATATAAPRAFDKVVLTLDACNKEYINSAKFIVSTNADFSDPVQNSDISMAKGTVEIPIENPAAGQYFKIALDLTKGDGSSNGFIQLSKLVLWVDAE